MDTSPFSTLPPELRNIIYGVVFAGSTLVVVDGQRLLTSKAPKKNADQRERNALAQTCRGLRNECTEMANFTTTFKIQFRVWLWDSSWFENFQARIGAVSASALRHVILEIGPLYNHSFATPVTEAVQPLRCEAIKHPQCEFRLQFQFQFHGTSSSGGPMGYEMDPQDFEASVERCTRLFVSAMGREVRQLHGNGQDFERNMRLCQSERSS